MIVYCVINFFIDFSLQIQIGYTSEPGEGGIIALRDYDRKFSPHVVSEHVFYLHKYHKYLVFGELK